MLVHIKDIVWEAKKNNYAVGAFNVHNFETILGVAKAAVEARSPAIIQVSEGAIEYMGLKPLTHLVSTVAKNLAAGVPIALHIDHGKSFDSVFACINAGFSSVHIDGSELPLDENIALTKSVKEAVGSKDVWVQGEVGPMRGRHGVVGDIIEEVPIAKLEEVVDFVKATNVDTIAAAIGSAHGCYKNEDIKFDLLQAIKEKLDTPFVLHGGSGIEDEKIKKAIQMGVNIINIGTDIKVAFSKTLIEVCKNNPEETDPRKLLRPTIDAVKKIAMEKMILFGSANRIK